MVTVFEYVKMIDKRNWAEISRGNVLHNVGVLRKLIGDGRILAPCVKGNAYGHGIAEIAHLFLEGGADWLCVDSIAEAQELRESGVEAPIYIMGSILLEELEDAVRLGFHFVVYNDETFEKLKEVTKDLGIDALTHLKLETGTNRQGIGEEKLPGMLQHYRDCTRIKLMGVATHFANIEDVTEHQYASQQLEDFKMMIKKIEENGFDPKYKHCANSAATILFPQTYFNMVRPGIAAYGYWPSKQTKLTAEHLNRMVTLKPALKAWKSIVAQVKMIKAGSSVGYGRSHEVNRDSRIAIVPVGYFNRLTRSLSNRNYSVLIKGRRAPIIGRVAMNMIHVDVSHIKDVKVEDEVVLIGKQGDREITPEEIAEKIHSINYEVVSSVDPGGGRRVVE